MRFTVELLLFTVAAATAVPDKLFWSNLRPRDLKVVPENPLESFSSLQGRITNGNVAELKQFPYQAGLIMALKDGYSWCGGTVISNRWILTAAHCTENAKSIDVYLGTFDRTDPREKGQQVVHVPSRYIIVHEGWNNRTLENDISLIKLPVVLTFNDYIQPAQLPKKSEAGNTYAGRKVIASGWGRISDSEQSVTDKLRWVEVTVMANDACGRRYGANSIKPTNICISTTGRKSTCNGDSGGPLVLSGTRTVVGATSFGIIYGCELGWPAVFTRVSSYLDWIEAKSGVVNK